MSPQKDFHFDGMNRAVAQRLSRCSSRRFSSAMAVPGWPRSLAAENGHGTGVLDVHPWNGTHLECCQSNESNVFRCFPHKILF